MSTDMKKIRVILSHRGTATTSILIIAFFHPNTFETNDFFAFIYSAFECMCVKWNL